MTWGSMGMGIYCLLEKEIEGAPEMQGKSLLAAYIGAISSDDHGEETLGSNIVALDFGGSIAPDAKRPGATESQLEAIGEFIDSQAVGAWHEPVRGLQVIKAILERVRNVESIPSPPEIAGMGFDDDEDLQAEVIWDLESLETILTLAAERQTRFRLVVDM